MLALDILPIEPLPDVDVILGDFREEAVEQQLEAKLEGGKVDVVLSDMAPNLSGVAAADAARSLLVAELALEFAVKHLKPDGAFLVKAFHGSGHSQYVERLKRHFRIRGRAQAGRVPREFGRGLPAGPRFARACSRVIPSLAARAMTLK